MTPYFICPHCHNPIDPLTLEVAVSANAQYRICPECDEPIVLLVSSDDADEEMPVPSTNVHSPVFVAESCIL